MCSFGTSHILSLAGSDVALPVRDALLAVRHLDLRDGGRRVAAADSPDSSYRKVRFDLSARALAPKSLFSSPRPTVNCHRGLGVVTPCVSVEIQSKLVCPPPAPLETNSSWFSRLTNKKQNFDKNFQLFASFRISLPWTNWCFI